MGKRTLSSLESDIRRILEGNDFISTSDEGGKQWYMNLVTDLANFVQREIEKAREEGIRETLEEVLGEMRDIEYSRSKGLRSVVDTEEVYRRVESRMIKLDKLKQ